MVAKILRDDDDSARPIPISLAVRRRCSSSASLDRVFAAGALRFGMKEGRTETMIFEDSYAKWLETILEATIMRNHGLEQGIKQLRSKNDYIRRCASALICSPCVEEEDGKLNESDGDNVDNVDNGKDNGSGNKQEGR